MHGFKKNFLKRVQNQDHKPQPQTYPRPTNFVLLAIQHLVIDNIFYAPTTPPLPLYCLGAMESVRVHF